jgi:restriction system protein
MLASTAATPAGHASTMTRRHKTSPIEDLLDAVALFPWWVGVALAPLWYIGLHPLAQQPAPREPVVADISDMAMAAMTQGLAHAGQYLLPAACLLAAGASAWWRRRRQQPARTEAPPAAEAVLQGLHWLDFVALVGEALRLRGYRVIDMRRGSGHEGGVDLVLHKAGETHLVQCQQWQAVWVGVDVLRELHGLMAERGAAVGWVLTAGRFTDEAVIFASGRHLRLVDGVELKSMLERAAEARRHRGVAPDMMDTVPAWPLER